MSHEASCFDSLDPHIASGGHGRGIGRAAKNHAYDFGGSRPLGALTADHDSVLYGTTGSSVFTVTGSGFQP